MSTLQSLSSVFAAASENQHSGGSFLVTLLFMGAIGAAMYFLMIRPQRRRLKESQEIQRAIGEGDEVITNAGIFGFVNAIDGDIVWLEFDPQAGHEQPGHRPALVLSPAAYNAKKGLMVCCPLSTQIKGYPFEVQTLTDGKPGVVLSDQVKSLDWRVRQAKKKGAVPEEVLQDVRAKIKALLQIG
jgi:mRNA interferase MazF